MQIYCNRCETTVAMPIPYISMHRLRNDYFLFLPLSSIHLVVYSTQRCNLKYDLHKIKVKIHILTEIQIKLSPVHTSVYMFTILITIIIGCKKVVRVVYRLRSTLLVAWEQNSLFRISCQ